MRGAAELGFETGPVAPGGALKLWDGARKCIFAENFTK